MSEISRRQLMKLAGWCSCGAALSSTLGPSLLLAEGNCGPGPGKAIVNIVLAGGFDGLFAFQPLHSGMRSALSTRRPQLVLPTSGAGATALSFGNELLGVHSNFSQHSGSNLSVKDLLEQGEAKLLACIGMPHDSRSHPDAMTNLMSGMFKYQSSEPGQWLGRLMDQCGFTPTQVFRFGSNPGLPLQRASGQPPVSIARSLQQYDWVNAENRLAADTLQQMLAVQSGLPERSRQVQEAMSDALDSIPELRPIQSTSLSGSYSQDSWGTLFADTARILKYEFRPGHSPRSMFIQIGLDGFDHHENLISSLGGAIASINRNIGALRTDLLGPAWNQTLLVISSEFGRSLFGASGSEHGHGNISLVAGGGFGSSGTQLIGRAPSVAELSASDPNPGQGQFAALPAVLDYRQVYAEALAWIGVPPDSLFPNYTLPESRVLPFTS